MPAPLPLVIRGPKSDPSLFWLLQLELNTQLTMVTTNVLGCFIIPITMPSMHQEG